METNFDRLDEPRVDGFMNGMSVTIADFTQIVLSEDFSLEFGVEGAKKQFLSDASRPGVKIKVFVDDQVREPRGEKLFDSGSVWRLFRQNRSYQFRFASLSFEAGPYKVASFTQDFSRGEVHLNRNFFESGRAVDPLGYPLDELLTMNLLAEGEGIEIHACGLADAEGDGHLFVGESGAGKTTMARLWQNEKGVKILSDDRVILRDMEGRLWMYGTPWHGEAGFAAPERVPLTRVYFLAKGCTNRICRISAMASVSRLFACSFPPFFSPKGLQFTLSFLEGVVQKAPCYELRFVPGKQVVKFIRRFKD